MTDTPLADSLLPLLMGMLKHNDSLQIMADRALKILEIARSIERKDGVTPMNTT